MIGDRRLEWPRLLQLGQIALSAVLLAYLLSRLNPEIIAVARSVGPGIFLLSAILMASSQAWGGLRLWTLLHRQGVPITRLQTIRLTYVGFFFSNFSPGTIGGDVAKGFFLLRGKVDPKVGVLALVSDRSINVIVTVALTASCVLASRLWHLVEVPTLGRFAPAAALAVAIVALAGGAWLYFAHRSSGVAERLHGFAATLAEARTVLSRWLTAPGTLLAAAALSLCSVMSAVVAQWFVFGALGANTGLVEFTAIIGLVILVAVIPISFNGLGVQELGLVFLLEAVGAPREAALAMAVISRLLIIVTGLIGGVLLATQRVPDLTKGGEEQR